MQSLTEFLNQLLGAGALNAGPSFFQVLGAFGLAYLGGVLSSLTPCVYPMIPITVSVIGGTAGKPLERRPWRDIALRGLIYVSGMTVVYAFLGVLAGLTGKVFGTLTNSSEWYLGISVIMSVSALIMLGVLPFDPIAWWNQFQRRFLNAHKKAHHTHNAVQHREVTLVGAFTLGASSGFIASPCTTPVLTAILAFIAKTQSIGIGLGLMFFFSLGIGTLLLVIATFTGALQALPKSGKWLNSIKLLSGLLLLAFGQYLIYRAGVLSR